MRSRSAHAGAPNHSHSSSDVRQRPAAWPGAGPRGRSVVSRHEEPTSSRGRDVRRGRALFRRQQEGRRPPKDVPVFCAHHRLPGTGASLQEAKWRRVACTQSPLRTPTALGVKPRGGRLRSSASPTKPSTTTLISRACNSRKRSRETSGFRSSIESPLPRRAPRRRQARPWAERRKLLVGVQHHGLACRLRGVLHGRGDSVLDRDPEVSLDLFLELHALEMRVVVKGLVGDALARSRPPRGFTPRAVVVRSVDCV